MRSVKNTDATSSGEVTAYNVVRLELANAIGVYLEARGPISALSYVEEFPRLSADLRYPN